MKRVVLPIVVAVSCLSLGVLGAVVAQAATTATTPTPEINNANANIQLSGTLKPVTCPGEDTIASPTGPVPTPYVTYTGTWAGAENDVTPGSTDYGLSGPLKVSALQWTINLNTGRGVLIGTVALSAAGTATPTYSGKLTLVTQGIPGVAGNGVSGRGWISAAIKVPDETLAVGDDNLIANVEFPTLTANGGAGWVGEVPGGPVVPSFSVVTNVAPTALDGVC